MKKDFTLAEVLAGRGNMLPVFSKAGFTLAEVLITLGIIGVVAAMTIPTLIANTQSSKYRNQYKKTLSTLNQAVKMNEANYDFNFNSAGQACNRKDNPDSVLSVCAIFNGSLAGVTIFDYTQLKTPKNTLYYKDLYNKGTTSDTGIKERHVNLYYYQLKDGSFFAFYSPTTSCTLGKKTIEEVMQDENFHRYCLGWIDVNGVSLPNREVRCKDGKSHTKDISANCIVPNSPNYMADVFPVIFYDGTVAPGSAASRYVLNTAK